MSALFLFPFMQGLGMGAGLIVAIGAQNSFVLRQGLKREHVFLVVSICSFCDILLISLGVTGMGALVAGSSFLRLLVTWGGALFLILYGARSFWAAFHSGTLHPSEKKSRLSRRAVIAAALSFSLLNPHAFLDVVILLGSVASHYPDFQRVAFAGGAMSASILWFFSLGYGAQILTPIFQRPISWSILDFCVVMIMWFIALSLINSI